jgi:S1-C subfamily serine protease
MPAKFLKSSDLQGVRTVEVGASAPLLQSDASIAAVVSRVPELQHFFAEPTITFDDNGDLKSAKWYTEFDHEVRRLDDLTGQKRERAEENLGQKLNAAARHVDDPEIGGLLTAMLNIASLDSICFVGTQPVLIDWGAVPRDEPSVTASERLSKLFPAVFAAGVAAAAVTSAASAEAASAEPEPESKAVAGHDETTSEDANVEAGDLHLAGAGGGAALGMAAVGNEHLARSNIVYIDDTPFYHRFWFRAVLYGLMILLIIWLLWWLLFARPGGILVRPPSVTGMHDSVVDGLQNERDRLKSLLEAPCGPAASSAISQGLTGAVAPPPPAAGAAVPGQSSAGTPSPGNQAEGTSPADAGSSAALPPVVTSAPGQMMAPQTLAHQMERSVAFILGAVPSGGVSMGTGFFISPDTIVTNRHVIESADPTKIAVTSEVMGKIQKVKVIAITSNSEIGTSDYAVLKLSSAANVVPVPLSTMADKLSRVVAVGYPGYLTNMDPKLRQLIGGDMSAAPETVFTSGEISVIQGGGDRPPVIIHTADMSQGNSGGPLVDQCGRVLGVNTFIGQDNASGRRGLFALGASDLMKFLDQNNVPYQRADGACTPPAAAGQEG